jgi:hypothetical protein
MRHAAAVTLIMSLTAAVAQADVYRSIDAQGHVQYSDTPTPGAELVHVQGSTSGGASLGSAPPTPARANPVNPAQSLTKANEQTQETLDKQAAQKAVQQDVDQTHVDQCAKAKADYEQAIQARRIYKTGADGEREYLSDADAETQRVNLRLQMQNLCGSSQ